MEAVLFLNEVIQFSNDSYTFFYDGIFVFQITIEKSPKYFVHPEAPARIKAMNANIKLLLIVRDPVVRLVSDYTHEIAINSTDKPFDEVVFLSNGNVNEKFVSLYHIL